MKIGDKTIINTNDCPFENQSELNDLQKNTVNLIYCLHILAMQPGKVV